MEAVSPSNGSPAPDAFRFDNDIIVACQSDILKSIETSFESVMQLLQHAEHVAAQYLAVIRADGDIRRQELESFLKFRNSSEGKVLLSVRAWKDSAQPSAGISLDRLDIVLECLRSIFASLQEFVFACQRLMPPSSEKPADVTTEVLHNADVLFVVLRLRIAIAKMKAAMSSADQLKQEDFLSDLASKVCSKVRSVDNAALFTMVTKHMVLLPTQTGYKPNSDVVLRSGSSARIVAVHFPSCVVPEETFVMKILHDPSEDVFNEFLVAALFRHPGICKTLCLRVEVGGPSPDLSDTLVMERITHTFEEQVFGKPDPRRTAPLDTTADVIAALDIAIELVRSMVFLHADPYIVTHRDLHPGNVGFRNSTPLVLDFGLSKRRDMQQQSLLSSGQSSSMHASYRHPGLSEPKAAFRRIHDLYSIGIVLYVLFFGKSVDPYPGVQRDMVFANVVNGTLRPSFKELPSMWATHPVLSFLRSVVQRCIDVEHVHDLKVSQLFVDLFKIRAALQPPKPSIMSASSSAGTLAPTILPRPLSPLSNRGNPKSLELFRWKDEKRRNEIETNQGTMTALTQLPLVNCLSVHGPSGHGKSFLLSVIASLLFGSPNAPRLQSSKNYAGTTVGVELYPFSFPLKRVSEIAKLTKSSLATWMNVSPVWNWKDHCQSDSLLLSRSDTVSADESELLLLDVEGTGHQDRSTMSKAVLPIMLLSQVIFYRLTERPGFTDTLQTLSEFGGKALRKVSGATDVNDPLFGHLIVVCGDKKINQEGCIALEAYLWDDEPTGSSMEDQCASIRERNLQRKTIRQAFASVHVHCLPLPVSDTALLEVSEIPLHNVSPEFLESVVSLISKCSPYFTATLNCNSGSLLRGSTLSEVTKTLVSAFEKADAVEYGSYMTLLSEIEAISVRDEVVRGLDMSTGDIRKTMPKNPTELDSQLAQVFSRFKTELSEKLTAKRIDEARQADQQQFIMAIWETKSVQLRADNLTAVDASCEQVRETAVYDVLIFTDESSQPLTFPEAKKLLHEKLRDRLPSFLSSQKFKEIVQRAEEILKGRYKHPSHSKLVRYLQDLKGYYVRGHGHWVLSEVRHLMRELQRGKPQELVEYATILRGSHLIDEYAESFLFQAHQMNPQLLKNSPALLIDAGRHAARTGRLEDAEALFQQSIEVERSRGKGNDVSGALVSYGLYFQSFSRWEEADAKFKEATTQDPVDPLSFSHRVTCLVHMEDMDSARAFAEEVANKLMNQIPRHAKSRMREKTLRALLSMVEDNVLCAETEKAVIEKMHKEFLNECIFWGKMFAIMVSRQLFEEAKKYNEKASKLLYGLDVMMRGEVGMAFTRFLRETSEDIPLDQFEYFAKTAFCATGSTESFLDLEWALMQQGKHDEARNLREGGTYAPAETPNKIQEKESDSSSRTSFRPTEFRADRYD
eukprot:ANDGO_00555.mRNA.1 hypothetical protein